MILCDNCEKKTAKFEIYFPDEGVYYNYCTDCKVAFVDGQSNKGAKVMTLDKVQIVFEGDEEADDAW